MRGVSKPVDHPMKPSQTESRVRGRKVTYINASVVIGAKKLSAWVRDISLGGAQIFLEHRINVGDRVTFSAQNMQRGAVVRWINYPLAGLEFDGGPGLPMPSEADLALAKKRAALRSFVPEAGTASRTTLSRWFNARK